MPSDLVFQGNFSFVNVDATSLSTLPHRQQVTRHVHGYRRWKKRQEARRLRESSRFHDSAEQRHSSTHPLQQQSLASSSGFRSIRPSLTPEGPAVEVPTPSTLLSLPPLIDVILLSGNSDPFDALPERLTATVNALLGFERDCIVPSIRELELRMTPKENAAREAAFTTTWSSESKAYLYDSISIHSYLARIATNRHMFTSQPEYLEAAHDFRRKGVASLKQYITTPDIDVLRLYRALLILLWADSSLGDRDAFKQHVTVLKDIFESHQEVLSADSSSHVYHFMSVVYFEVQYAVMSLTKTSLDLDHKQWVEKQFTPLWVQLSPTFPFPRRNAERHLDIGLQDEIRSLYLDAQEIVDVIKVMRMDSALNTSMTWFYAVSKTVLTIGRLVNLYVQSEIESVIEHGKAAGLDVHRFERLQTAALCLCVVFWLRELAGIEHVYMTEHIRIFTWNPIMLANLRQIMSVWEEARKVGAWRGPAQSSVELWIYWTGGMAEHTTSSSLSTPDEVNLHWFSTRFCRHIWQEKIDSLSNCHMHLDQLIRVYGMRPNGVDDWYTGCFP